MEGNGVNGFSVWAWVVFGVAVVVLLGVDIWSFRKRAFGSRKKQLRSTVMWVAAGIGFGIFVWAITDGRLAAEYFGAYVMEKGLSLDNIFLFYVIFESLSIPEKFQHKVLMWGVLGAVFFRGVFIFAGVSALARWEWLTHVFAGALIYAAWRALRKNPAHNEKSRVTAWLAEKLPFQERAQSGRFFERRGEQRVATPLFVALATIELTDVLFAIDSVPAALSITQNRFVIYSSNVFAVLGLRSLYLYLAGYITSLPYLHYGLALVLAFAGFKIGFERWIQISPAVSMGVVILTIGASVWASMRSRKRKEPV